MALRASFGLVLGPFFGPKTILLYCLPVLRPADRRRLVPEEDEQDGRGDAHGQQEGDARRLRHAVIAEQPPAIEEVLDSQVQGQSVVKGKYLSGSGKFRLPIVCTVNYRVASMIADKILLIWNWDIPLTNWGNGAEGQLQERPSIRRSIAETFAETLDKTFSMTKRATLYTVHRVNSCVGPPCKCTRTKPQSLSTMNLN